VQRHDTHHFSPSDSFSDSALGAPGETSRGSASDSAHVCDVVREKVAIKRFTQGIDAELVEDIVTTGFGSRRAEISAFVYFLGFESTLHGKATWFNRLVNFYLVEAFWVPCSEV